MSFVGIKQLSSVEELGELLTQRSSKSSYYFLRWAHKVSGIVNQLHQDFPSSEGQMFNEDWELRWKQQKKGYEVLILSKADNEPGFNSVGQGWKTQLRQAHVYGSNETRTETRFPKEFITDKVKLAQRYFIDEQTATVHFVALAVSNKND